MSSPAGNNVVMFPQSRIVSNVRGDPPPQTIEEVVERVSAVRAAHVEQATEMIGEILLEQIAVSGFDNSGKSPQLNTAFLIEMLRATLCSCYGLEHPFQQIVAKSLSMQKNGKFKLKKKFTVAFKEESEAIES